VSAYFIGLVAIVCSGILLKKTKPFAGDVAPFVMELPAYHWPTVGGVLRSMWERGWSFIKKAGTLILLATIVIWFLSGFGFSGGKFGMVEMNDSLLAAIGGLIAPLFSPLGWGDWRSAVATFTGLIAKENVVGTFGILFHNPAVAEDGFEIWEAVKRNFGTGMAAYSFLLLNLLCAPCFAAMGAIKREMNNAKWFWFAIGYQCGLAYIAALCMYQLGTWFTAGAFGIGTVIAVALLIAFLFLLLRPAKKNSLGAKVYA
jgi:ferrous iron transport protein B